MTQLKNAKRSGIRSQKRSQKTPKIRKKPRQLSRTPTTSRLSRGTSSKTVVMKVPRDVVAITVEVTVLGKSDHGATTPLSATRRIVLYGNYDSAILYVEQGGSEHLQRCAVTVSAIPRKQ